MKLLELALILSTLFSITGAIYLPVAVRNAITARPKKRQSNKTYTVTCLGVGCTDYPPTTLSLPTTYSVPGGIPTLATTTPTTPTPTPTPKPSSTKQTSTSKTPETSMPKPPETSSPVKSSSPVKTSEPAAPTKTAKSSHKPPPAQTGQPAPGPSSTACPVPLYYQCGGYYGGVPWTGCTKCVAGATCVYSNDYYYQCVANDDTKRQVLGLA